jgi:hypothetical protein
LELRGEGARRGVGQAAPPVIEQVALVGVKPAQCGNEALEAPGEGDQARFFAIFR